MFIESGHLIIIAFVPRSGSNYLCDMMCRVGGFGAPLEFYYPYDFQERIAFWDAKTNPFEHVDKNKITTEISWFMEVLIRGGLKCTWDSHEQMLVEVGELLDRVKVQYIYLRRRDKLRQAISWYRADENQQWTSKDQKSKPDPPYNEAEIRQRLDYIELDEKRWGEFFQDKEHLELFYEDLNYGVLDTVEAFTGLKRDRDRYLDSDYKVLRDELTEEWVRRYAESHNDKRDSNPVDG
jgi:LPS sulfotransferase NodH